MNEGTFLYDLILIAIVVISLGAGAASVLMAIGLNRKFSQDYLSDYVYYQILLVVNGVYNILGIEAVKFLIPNLESSYPQLETAVKFLPYLGLPFLITAWYMFVKICSGLIGKKLSGIFSLIYSSFMLVVFLVAGLGILNTLHRDNPSSLNAVYLFRFTLIILQVLTMVIAGYFLFIKSKQVKSLLFKKTVLRFGLISILIQVITLGLYLFHERWPVLLPFYLIIYFGNGIIPLLILDTYFTKHYLTEKAIPIPGPDLLRAKYNISKREMEIIEQICKGLTNSQISNILFISIQTVKDHSHTIYRKLGVKNRVQMVNMVRNFSLPDKKLQ